MEQILTYLRQRETIGLMMAILAGILLTIGDIALKEWLKSHIRWHLIVGFLIYNIGIICIVLSFRDKNIATASMIMIIVNVVLLVLFSWLYFEEPLSTNQLIGVGLGIAAVIAMEL